MGEIKVYLSNDLNEKFRRIAMAVYGYGRGSLSKAAEEAFARWCSEHDGTSKTANASGSAETGNRAIVQTTRGINPDERTHDHERRDTNEKSNPSDKSDLASNATEGES